MERRETDTGRIRGTRRELDDSARHLRTRMTPAEKALWNSLRGRQLDGLKFRRQHPLGPFVVDFCCPERSLIVEVDGAIHDDQAEYDATRTEMLEEFGYRIIRFQNDEVLNKHEVVLNLIASVAQNRAPARLIYKTQDI